MTMDLAHQADFSVGSLRIRPAVLQVDWDGKSETLEPRIMQVLVVLGQRAGDVVSRDDLIKECWDGRAVGDDALNRCISRLRKLGEASAAFALETIPRVGYRLKLAEGAPTPATAAGQKAEAEPTAPVRKTSRKPLFIGAVALAALAVAGIGTVTMMQSRAGSAAAAPVSQRTAFFGFSIDGDDGVASGIAKSATSETFATLGVLGLETAPETQTQNIERSAQLARAKDLGARYALGGDVQHDGDKIRIAIRLEDVDIPTTLFQDTLSGDDAQKVRLASQAAVRAVNALQCYIGARVGLRPVLRTETSEILSAMVRVCSVKGDFRSQAEARRALARLAPDSPGVQTNLALWLFLALPYTPPAYQPATRQEIDAAVDVSLKADPNNGFARAINADFWIADGKSLVEAEKLFQQARDGDRGLFYPNLRYGIFLRSVGRYREAVPYLEESKRQNPLTATPTTLAHTLGVTGQPGSAKALYEDVDTRGPSNVNWQAWISSALFDDAAVGDPREIVKRVPPDASPDTANCVKALVDGKLSKDPKQHAAAAQTVLDCVGPGNIEPLFAMQPLAALGMVDEAFAVARKDIVKKGYTFGDTVALFATGSAPMRADPKFPQLMKDLGIYQYWVESRKLPDFCERPEETNLQLCTDLRAAQGGK